MNSGFREDVARAYAELRARMREQFRRDLPFQELVTDRWERARSLGFGEGSSIYQSAYVFGDVSVGARTWIGPGVVLDGSGSLSIGSGCDISAGVQLYSHDTVARVLSDGREDIQRAPLVIQDHCHVGAQAVVVKGVTVGHHSVIGALAFVNHDVAPYTIVAGVPARPIGRVLIDESGEVSLAYETGGKEA